MERGNIVHDFAEKALYEKGQSLKNNLIVAFLRVLEQNAGVEFYKKLFSIFASYKTLIGGNKRYRELLKYNNQVLSEYSKQQKTMNDHLKKYDRNLKTYIESFVDIEYHAEYDRKFKIIKGEISYILDEAASLNNLMKKSCFYDDEIKKLKEKQLSALLSSRKMYAELRRLGAVNIFKPNCKAVARNQFRARVNEDVLPTEKFELVFNTLWNYAVEEARVLIAAANECMSLANTLKSGVEKLDEARVEKYQQIVEKFNKTSVRLSSMTDEELLNAQN